MIINFIDYQYRQTMALKRSSTGPYVLISIFSDFMLLVYLLEVGGSDAVMKSFDDEGCGLVCLSSLSVKASTVPVATLITLNHRLVVEFGFVKTDLIMNWCWVFS